MTFDLSSLVWLLFALAMLQPVLAARWCAAQRARTIRAIERARGSRVITMIHRQEKASVLGVSFARHIDLEDAQTLIAAIAETPDDMPIDFVLHTPGGLVLAAMQIARAVRAHKGKVTVHVPVYAMSGGTLIALAADEIVMGDFSLLGPIDPQLAGLPAASLVAASRAKPIEHVSDLTWRSPTRARRPSIKSSAAPPNSWRSGWSRRRPTRSPPSSPVDIELTTTG